MLTNSSFLLSFKLIRGGNKVFQSLFFVLKLTRNLTDEISEVFENLERENDSLELLIKEVNSDD